MMKRHVYAISTPLFLLTALSPLVFGQNAILTIDEPLEDQIKSLDVSIEFGLGELQIERGNPAKAVTGMISYDRSMMTPELTYRSSGSKGFFNLRASGSIAHKKWGFNLKRQMRDMNAPHGEVYLTTRVPIYMDINCGLGEAKLNLGELHIADFKLDNGLGEVTFDFSSRNKIECRLLSVDNGLGELDARNLSNARANQMIFDCGLGAATLDFSGEEYHDMYVKVNVGLGSVNIKVPRGYNLEMEAEESFLSSISISEMVQESRGFYRNTKFINSQPTLRIKASVGLGNIDVNWID